MTVHWVDRLWAAVIGRPRMFPAGWGAEEAFARLAAGLVDPPRPIAPAIDGEYGTFESPLAADLPGPARLARFRWIRPRDDAPTVVILAATGEHGFGRRARWAAPLVRDGVGALILENPRYGLRKPPDQARSAMPTVADGAAMAAATVAEGKALIAWLRASGARKVAVSGYSMGGAIAGLVASTLPFEVPIVAAATGISPAPVYTRGFLSRQVMWDRLGDDAVPRLHAEFERVSLARQRPPTGPAILLGYEHDGYVSPDDVRALAAHWPHAQVHWRPGGHVWGAVSSGPAVRQALLSLLTG